MVLAGYNKPFKVVQVIFMNSFRWTTVTAHARYPNVINRYGLMN